MTTRVYSSAPFHSAPHLELLLLGFLEFVGETRGEDAERVSRPPLLQFRLLETARSPNPWEGSGPFGQSLRPDVEDRRERLDPRTIQIRPQ
jgi:hypothetical protein